jgi:NAD(P)-dependent dehydrogenase (short-subunit alcohol dehydrogenase family)
MQRIAVVTGAGSGIGRFVALALAQANYQVVLTGRRQQALEESKQLIEKIGGSALALPADIKDPLSVQNLFATVRQEFGRIDLLFNNAGVPNSRAEIENISFDDWRNVIDTNLTGAFLCTQEALRLMKSQTPRGGRIINNGSVSSQSPRPMLAAYTATKHALTGLTKSVALEGRPYDIACGQIDLGVVQTDAADWIVSGQAEQADGTTSSEPTLDPQCVADTVLYMANLPLEANVLFMTLMPTKMKLVGRG